MATDSYLLDVATTIEGFMEAPPPGQKINRAEYPLHFVDLHGSESLSRLFSFQATYMVRRDHKDAKDQDLLEKIIGKKILIELRGKEKTSYNKKIVGWISRVVDVDRHYDNDPDTNQDLIKVEIVPWLWFLNHSSHCRIFQNKNIPDILKEVLSVEGLDEKVDMRLDLKRYPVLEYCTQYNESDAAFAMRLMEEAGIYFYFEHDKNNSIVLCDDIAKSEPIPGTKSDIKYRNIGLMSDSRPEEANVVFSLERFRAVSATKYKHSGFNFKNPTPFQSESVDSRYTEKTGFPVDQLEIYDYPEQFRVQGKKDFAVDKNFMAEEAKTRLEQERYKSALITGQQSCLPFNLGRTFKLKIEKGHHPKSLTPEIQDKELFITSLYHQINTDNQYNEVGYGGRFACIEKENETEGGLKNQFRPARITKKPVMKKQTATVVGNTKDEEIYTDKYGRIKVHFHWDLDEENLKDKGESSCWIRVAQTGMGGPHYGHQFIPRVKQEVLVDFLEGDPDRPVVTGVIYNGSNMPPYEPHQDKKTISGIKTQTYKGSPDQFNELYFDDATNEQLIYTQAEKDFRQYVKNDSETTIDNNRDLSIKVDSATKIDGNRGQTVVGKSETTIMNGHTLTITNNSDVDITGMHNVSVTGMQNNLITQDQNNMINGMRNSIIAKNSNDAVTGISNNMAGLGYIISSPLFIQFQVGTSMIRLDPTGIIISGMSYNFVSMDPSAKHGIQLNPQGELHISGKAIKMDSDPVKAPPIIPQMPPVPTPATPATKAAPKTPVTTPRGKKRGEVVKQAEESQKKQPQSSGSKTTPKVNKNVTDLTKTIAQSYVNTVIPPVVQKEAGIDSGKLVDKVTKGELSPKDLDEAKKKINSKELEKKIEEKSPENLEEFKKGKEQANQNIDEAKKQLEQNQPKQEKPQKKKKDTDDDGGSDDGIFV